MYIQCGINSRSNIRRSNVHKFITDATNIHGDNYDYSKVNYYKSSNKIIIICKIHCEFIQIPDFHVNRKCGCPKCANNVKLGTLEFIEKAKQIHGNKYVYSKVKYITPFLFSNAQ